MASTITQPERGAIGFSLLFRHIYRTFGLSGRSGLGFSRRSRLGGSGFGLGLGFGRSRWRWMVWRSRVQQRKQRLRSSRWHHFAFADDVFRAHRAAIEAFVGA